MALKDKMEFGFVLPCRSWAPVEVEQVRRVAKRADELGFRDLWVTENAMDESYSFDPFVVLSYAAAMTERIRLGVSRGRACLCTTRSTLLTRLRPSTRSATAAPSSASVSAAPAHYRDFGVPTERRVGRFLEGVEVIKRLWTQPEADFHGEFFDVQHAMALKPVQKPHPPLWLGGAHPNTLPRAARVADGWMGAGGSSWAELKAAIPALHEALAKVGKDPAQFPISKRIFMSVDEDASAGEGRALPLVHRGLQQPRRHRNPRLLRHAGAVPRVHRRGAGDGRNPPPPQPDPALRGATRGARRGRRLQVAPGLDRQD